MTRVPEPCGYGCGKPWVRWQGTRLIGHAACAGLPELHDDCLALVERFPQLTEARLAVDLGVSAGVLRSWLKLARARRGRHLRALR